MSAQASDLWNANPNDEAPERSCGLCPSWPHQPHGAAAFANGHPLCAGRRQPDALARSDLDTPSAGLGQSYVLNEQLDMRRVDLREGIIVYENLAAAPMVLDVAKKVRWTAQPNSTTLSLGLCPRWLRLEFAK